jgi:hypothetical protein
MKKTDRMYRNSGKAMATRIQQNALNISRSNAKDAGPWNVPRLMSEEGERLAKLSAPCSPYEIPYVDSRQRFSLGDDEPEMWRRFKSGDQTPWDDPEVEDPDEKLFAVNTDESEEEPEDDEEEESETAENESLARTQGAFDRQRLYRAIDRLSRKSKRRVASRDGRSYGRDGRSYSTCSGFIGGVEAWNAAFARGEVC